MVGASDNNNLAGDRAVFGDWKASLYNFYWRLTKDFFLERLLGRTLDRFGLSQPD